MECLAAELIVEGDKGYRLDYRKLKKELGDRLAAAVPGFAALEEVILDAVIPVARERLDLDSERMKRTLKFLNGRAVDMISEGDEDPGELGVLEELRDAAKACLRDSGVA